MRTLYFLILLLLFAFFAACRQQTTEQKTAATPSPVASASTTPANITSPHPNQVSVSLGKTSTESAKLNPRIAEAYAPEKVTLERTATGPPAGFSGAPEPQTEAAPDGMKWVIVLVDLDAPKGEFSLPLNKIRMIDQANKSYRLVSFGGTEGDQFTDLREYDKYQMVEPPKMIMRSDKPTRQNFLFAVPAKAEGLKFEF